MTDVCRDGQTMLAAADASTRLYVLISRDFGTSWGISMGGNWNSIACSGDGTAMLGTSGHGGNGPIIFSIDGGHNWTNVTTPGVNGIAVAVSVDGTKMVSVGRSTPIFSSNDSGTTWAQDDAPVTNWSSVACSADGCRLVAAVNGGGIYIWQRVPAPRLRAVFSTGSIVLSWVLPSIDFVLEQSQGVLTSKWATVAVKLVLNYTNLQYEVTVPKTNQTMFYRLGASHDN